jgi:cell wall-associated NlpC family hydrolase
VSGRFLRLVCTAAIAAGAALSPAPTGAAAEPGERPVAVLLTDLQRLYRQAEQATETYNTTEEKLNSQRAEVAKLNRRLARARLSLHDSRSAAARLARQQYQSSTEISPYVRLLLARDPQHALDQGHVIRQLSKRRAATVNRLIGSEKKTDGLARAARKALDGQLTLAERQKKDRDAVQQRLKDVEELLTSLSADQLAELAELEKAEVAEAQEELVTSGALGSNARPPSRQGEAALRYAVEQIGKPYEWGTEGPDTYDCSGLTSQAWAHAGQPIPRTSQEQWDQLQKVPLSELRPGDLVVYFPEATHVALYLGDGMVIHAPRPDATVKVSPLAANPVLGAVRPDPAGEPVRQYTPPKLPPGARDGSDEGYEGESYEAEASASPATDAR